MSDNDVSIGVEHMRSPITKVAAFIPMSTEVWIDNGFAVRGERHGSFVHQALDGFLHPWKYADRAAMPTIDIFPRLTRWTCRARAVASLPRRARQRLRDVVDVARHGMPELDEDRW